MRRGCFEEFSMKLLPECRMRSRFSTPRGCSRPCVKTILTLEKQRSSSRTPGKRGMSTFTAGSFSVVIAEIELKQESQELILPRWIGREVTGDSFYKKINMRTRLLLPAVLHREEPVTRPECCSAMARPRPGSLIGLKATRPRGHALLRDQNRLTGNAR